jgi:uncharacterized lipoprotein YmbA
VIRPDRWVIVALLGMVAGGCVRFGTRPPLERYRLEIPPPPSAPAALPGGTLLPGLLAVLPYATPGLYGRDPIVYRVGEIQLDVYPNREWAIPLRDQLGVATARLLEGRPLTSQPAVYDPSSLRPYAFVWRGRVREFEEVNRGDTVLAAVALEVQLVRTIDDSVVWAGRYRDERIVPPPNTTMEPIVHMLSVLTAEAINGLIDSARVELRIAAVESARSPR